MSDAAESAIDAAAGLRERLRANEKSDVTGVVDVLVVGAGAAGIAAAFRCVELGLSTVLIDRDDVLSVLRDWVHSTKNYVDANYNATARKTPFPGGGELVAQLAFKDHTTAIDLYNRWLGILCDSKMPIRTGMELVGLRERDGGAWEAECRRGKEQGLRFETRSVVLALGSGVPTPLDIPGDTTSIASRVGSGERFVGGPACVIGSGTSAAEAMISIVKLKQKAKDRTPVYWSYRTASLPKVNDTLDKSLGEVVKNECFRQLASSQAMAVLREPEGSEYVAKGADYLIVRVERLAQGGGAARGSFLEFATSRVLACIGSQPPMEFLKRLGIQELKAVDQDVEALGVTPWFESCRKNVFLVGEPLSPAYIQTTDFRPEADQVTVIQHTGSFKQSFRDGVLAAESIHARLRQGATDERLRERITELEEEWKRGFVPDDVPRPAVPVESLPVVTARFARIIDTESEIPFTFPVGAVRIDPESGQVAFGKGGGQGWTLLDVRADGCYVADPSAVSRTMLQIGVERTIAKDELFSAGNQTLCIRDLGGQLMLCVLDPEMGTPIKMFPIPPAGQDFGRRQSKSVVGIDAGDRYLSQRHFRVQGEGNAFAIRDYGSLNGTFVRVRSTETKLIKGDVIWVDQRRFRFDGYDGTAGTMTSLPAAAPAPQPAARVTPGLEATRAPALAPVVVAEPVKAPAPKGESAPPKAEPAPAAKVKSPAGTGAPRLTIPSLGKSLDVNPEKSLLDELIAAGIATKAGNEAQDRKKLLWSCGGVPSCYFCILKVVSGAEHLSEMSKKEQKGLKLKTSGLVEEGFELDPAACRLACMTQAKGPVEVEFLGNTDC